MKAKLSSALQSVTPEEFECALEQIQDDVARTQQAVYQAHAAQIRRKYKGFSHLLNLEPDEEDNVLCAGKVEGYRFSASLFVTVAENRPFDDLQSAFCDLDPDAVMEAFYGIIAGTPADLVAEVIASRSAYPCFCDGVSRVFRFLNAGNKTLQQMAFGLTIFTGVLLRIAGDGEPAAIRETSGI